MSFEPSDVSVTATLIGNLTQDAVQDSEVIVSYIYPCKASPPNSNLQWDE